MAIPYYLPKLATLAALGMVNPGRTASSSRRARSQYSVTRRKTPYKKPTSMVQVIRNMETAHHAPVGDNVNQPALLHNTLLTQNILFFVSQGTGQGNRTGDTIFNESLKINATWEGPAALVNGTQLRMLLLYHDDYHANGTLLSGLGLNDLAMLTTGIARSPALLTDPKKCTVLDDRTFVLNQSISGASDVVNIRYTVPVKKRFDFIPGTQEGKDRNLYLVVIPSIALGVTGVTSCGSLYVNTDIIYKISK